MNKLEELKLFIEQRNRVKKRKLTSSYFDNLEVINKEICRVLHDICRNPSNEVKLYLIHNDEEIVLDQPDEVYVDVENGEIIGAATYWSLWLGNFTYDLITYDVPRKGPYCLEFKFYSTRITTKDIILQIKGELTDEN